MVVASGGWLRLSFGMFRRPGDDRHVAGPGDPRTLRLRAVLSCVLLTIQQASAALAADTRANPACVVPAGDTATGSVNDMRDLPAGGVLIGAEDGLFRYEPARIRFVPAGDTATGSVKQMLDLPGGGVLINAEKGLFR